MRRLAGCGHRVDEDAIIRTTRTGGGSYNRAARQMRVTICAPCARDLLAVAATYGPGHATVSRYSIGGLRRGLERLA